MIYTVTMNPCLDYVVELEQVRLGRTNRAKGTYIRAGGKGINVSLMLNQLNVENRATGFVAGFTGDEITAQLSGEGIAAEFLTVSGLSRINVKLWAEEETEVNGTGPMVAGSDVRRLFRVLEKAEKQDIIVLSGSIPATLPMNIYGEIACWAEQKRIPLAVDATGELLRDCLPYHPFLIKPNLQELEELFGQPLKSDEEVLRAADELRREGAQNVLVSMGGGGALLAAEDAVYRAQAPQGKVIGTVGAGDSMVAGFLSEFSKKPDLGKALSMAVAAGSATAFSPGLGCRSLVMRLAAEIQPVQVTRKS